ncbi:BTB/POZ and MATH domain-containing protein 2-like [Panicum virgatum]|nr:BTB/POZ and MATH domain-containing protein 2-like [Panicum virgatum]
MDDSFRISCHVTVVNINVVGRNTLLYHVPPPMDDLRRDLGALLTSKIGADVEFKVGRETFMAHRSMLASRSSVFEAEFFGFMQEMKKETQILIIQDMEPRVFEAMLHFIYTDSQPEIDEGDTRVLAQHLLVAADRYNLQRLKLISEDILCKSIDTNTAATTLALAEQHGFHRLKEGCFNFLKCQGNMKAVMETDGFGHLMSSCPSLLIDLLARISP